MASKLYEQLNYFNGFGEKIFKVYDPNKVYQYNHWIYVFSGFWKYESPKRWKTSLYKFYKTAIVLTYGVAVVFFIIDAIIVRDDFDKLSFNMSSSVLVMTKMTQIIMLSSLKSGIDWLNDGLDNHLYVETVGKSEEDKSIFKHKAEIITKITFMFYSLLMMGLPIRVIADSTLDTKPYLIPVPFKENFEAYYEYVYAQQVFISFHFMMTTLAYDLIGFSFIIRYIAHYEILEKNFLKIKSFYPRRNFEKYVRGYVENRQAAASRDILIRKTNYSEKMQKVLKEYKPYSEIKRTDNQRIREEKTFQMLKQNVNHHQKLLEGINTYFAIYSRPFLIQIGGMVILLGIAVIQVLFLSHGINLQLLQQVLYACTTLFNLLCLCSFGSELTSKSIETTHALYDTPWYDMSISNRNMVSLILQKLSQAPVLKGGGMINIDRVTCVKFLQSSYNMGAVLRKKI